jgi:acetate kinase
MSVLEKEGISDGRIIVAHLGHGASLAAVANGTVLDTTMGFTPAGGFPMCSRSGDLDPGVVLAMIDMLAAQHPTDTASSISQKLRTVINSESGLVSFTACGNDIRKLCITATPSVGQDHTVGVDMGLEATNAQFALDYFVYHLVKAIGSFIAALGGMDTLVFTAGIGAHSSKIRSLVCARLGYCGLLLDETHNARVSGDCIISTAESAVRVYVIDTNEEIIIAQQAYYRTMGLPMK